MRRRRALRHVLLGHRHGRGVPRARPEGGRLRPQAVRARGAAQEQARLFSDQAMKESLTRLEDALKVVLDTVPVLGVEKIGLLDALGRVLAEDIIAERDNPPWDNSAMDGFAVRYEDIQQAHAITTSTVLKVIEDVPAGKFPAKPVGKGEAIRIMTGAPIPKGADTVLKVEDTENTPTTVKVFKEVEKGQHPAARGRRPQGRLHH